MFYRIGDIFIQIMPSSPLWTENAVYALNRQLDGYQANGVDQPVKFHLKIFDYDHLPVQEKDATSVVPGYSYSTASIYIDSQQKLAIESSNNTLNIWCSKGCRGVSIPFLLQQLFLQEEKSFVHAAGIVVEGAGILLPAFGGIGKTAFIAKVCEQSGIQILGDDLIVVTKKGELEPYLRPFALYKYHQPLFPSYFSDQNVKYKPLTLSWRIFNKIRRSMGEIFNQTWRQPDHIIRTGYIPVSPKKILPPTKLATGPVPLDRIYLLKRSAQIQKTSIQNIDQDEAINFMLNVINHEWYGQVRFLLAWQAHHSQSFYDYISQIETIYRSAMASCKSIQLIQIPLKIPITEVGLELVRHVLH